MIKYPLKYVKYVWKDKQKWNDDYELRLQFFNVKLIDMKNISIFYFILYYIIKVFLISKYYYRINEYIGRYKFV